MTDSILEIRRLAVRRGGRDILRVERLDVGDGEVVAVLGPNGAGKSTLLKCMLGFTRPTEGELRTLGQSVWPRGRTSIDRLRRRIGYVAQSLVDHGETPLTVREVVAIGRTGIVGLLRRFQKSDWNVVDEWIERLGLTALAGRRYGDLSGGEQRKALIAKAMVQQPELLLLDEPTANLDLFWRERIVETLDRLCQQTRLAVLLVCHELEAIPSCAGRLLAIRDGRILADGPPREVMTSAMVERLYAARLRVLAGQGRWATVPFEEAGR